MIAIRFCVNSVWPCCMRLPSAALHVRQQLSHTTSMRPRGAHPPTVPHQEKRQVGTLRDGIVAEPATALVHGADRGHDGARCQSWTARPGEGRQWLHRTDL